MPELPLTFAIHRFKVLFLENERETEAKSAIAEWAAKSKWPAPAPWSSPAPRPVVAPAPWTAKYPLVLLLIHWIQLRIKHFWLLPVIRFILVHAEHPPVFIYGLSPTSLQGVFSALINTIHFAKNGMGICLCPGK